MHFFHVLLNVLIFAVLGILLGFTVDYIFPPPTDDEGVGILWVLILTQIVFTAILIYYIDRLYEYVFGVDSDTYFGMTIFMLLFFLVQQQLFYRLNLLSIKLTGQSLVEDV